MNYDKSTGHGKHFRDWSLITGRGGGIWAWGGGGLHNGRVGGGGDM